MAQQEMSILKEAAEIIRTQPPSYVIGHLRTCTDDLREQYDLLKVACTRSQVTRFIAAATRCLLAIEKVKTSPPVGPTSGSGDPSVAEEQLAAAGNLA